MLLAGLAQFDEIKGFGGVFDVVGGVAGICAVGDCNIVHFKSWLGCSSREAVGEVPCIGFVALFQSFWGRMAGKWTAANCCCSWERVLGRGRPN